MEFGKYRIGKTEYNNNIYYFTETRYTLSNNVTHWIRGLGSYTTLKAAQEHIDARITFDNIPPAVTTYTKYP